MSEQDITLHVMVAPELLSSSSICCCQQVQAFLRGPEQSFILSGCFGGIAEARRAVSTLTSSNSYRSNTGSCSNIGYSINATACGTGCNARVQITKTQEWFKGLLKSKQQLQQELRGLQAMQRQVVALAAPQSKSVLQN